MNPRYSIIPAGAVTDPRIEPRDLQVLCLLGRHIDDLGWCRRSQVKMAREIGCARSTLQGSLERLVAAEWVEMHVQPSDGRGTTAYSYRVRLDVNEGDSYYRDLPKSGRGRKQASANGQSENHADIAAGSAPADQSAPPLPSQERHPLPIYASAPLTSPVERFEREAREGDTKAIKFQAPDDTEAEDRFQKLLAAYPAGAIGNVDAARSVFGGLDVAGQEASLEALPRVRAGWKREGRDHVFSLQTYLKNKDWERFPKATTPSGHAVDDRVPVAAFSRAAWAIFRKALEANKPVTNAISWIRNGAEVPAPTYPTDAEQQALVAIAVGSPEHKAWRQYGHRLGFTLPMPDKAEWIFLPSKNPPHLKLSWKGYHTVEPVSIEAGGPAWWWRLFQPGAPMQTLLDDRSHGAIKLTMGPIPIQSEIESMIQIDVSHPSFHAWDTWFSMNGCKTLLSLRGPIWVPTLNPAALSDPPETLPDYEAIDALEFTEAE